MAPIQSSQDLARRQIALLGKMLLYSIDNLSEDEHEIYDSLVEELASRADSKHEVNVRALTPSAAGPSHPQKEAHLEDRPIEYPKSREGDSHSLHDRRLQGVKPDKVVRLFIECWDKHDFKQEYHCMSDRFEQGSRARQTLEEFIAEREEKHASRHMAGPMSKQVVDISDPIVDGDMAAVQVAERHTGRNEDMILYRTYNLVFEKTSWRILNFKTNQKRGRKRL